MSVGATVVSEGGSVSSAGEKVLAALAAEVKPDPAAGAAPAEGAPPVEAPKEDVSREMAILHRQKKKLQEEKKAQAERQKKFEEYEAKKAKAKEDPESFLTEAGLTIDDLVQWKLRQGEPLTAEEQAKLLESKVNKTVEERLAEHQKKKDEEAAAAKTEAEQIRMKEDINAFRNTLDSVIESNPEQYELISVHGEADTAMLICAQAIAENPDAYKTREDAEKLIPRVLEMLEAQLLEDDKAKFEKSKKLKSFYGKVEETKKDTTPEALANPAPPTLTNSMNSPTPPETKKPGALLSREESLKLLSEKLKASNPARWSS